jgi:transcriptional regulator with XRE-family HTH domain
MTETKEEKAFKRAAALQIGKAWLQARKRQGLTQEAAADLLSIRFNYYSRVERGESVPSTLLLMRSIGLLKVRAEDLDMEKE